MTFSFSENFMCEKKILIICRENLFLKMKNYMLDKKSLMYFSCEIGSCKHVQVPKGILVVCVGHGEGELKLYLSKIDVVTVCGGIK